jgi:hypothetical protein
MFCLQIILSLFLSFAVGYLSNLFGIWIKNGNFSFLNFLSSKSSSDHFLCFPGSSNRDTSFQRGRDFFMKFFLLRWCIFSQNPHIDSPPLQHHSTNRIPTTQLTQLTQINPIKPDNKPTPCLIGSFTYLVLDI